VKRVVGLPGDTIELRHDLLFINGIRQSYTAAGAETGRDLAPEDRAVAVFAREKLGTHDHAVMALPRIPALRDFGPMVVPADAYVMLGDNRDNSRDSRYFGFMPRHAIIGEVKAVVVSADLSHWLKPRFDRWFSAIE
jgi:signal peptidase I